MVEPAKHEAVLRDIEAAAEEIAKDLSDFGASARVLSSRHPRLIEEFAGQWIAVWHGEVYAHGASLDDVLTQISERRIPKEQAIIRFIEKHRRTMIL